VLQYLSIGRWTLVAIVVAGVAGGVMSLLRIPMLVLLGASVAGLLLGGTWAAWRFPNDVPISVAGGFESHLESLWRQVLILMGTFTVSGFCCPRFLGGGQVVDRTRPGLAGETRLIFDVGNSVGGV
jgi:hypothetical protein